LASKITFVTSSPESLIGNTIDERYRIEAIVARGGMATVYIASDLRLQRTVALKVMHATLAQDPDFVARFEREARASAALTHPHVVAIHDQGRDSALGVVYLVMELVNGHTVRELLNERGPVTATQALAVMDPVLQGLAAAHLAGFIHRDIKPENVMISDDGRIKVADFGLARAIIDSATSAMTRGVLIGTVAYLSPEQVEHGLADERSDIYSAGILLFEMVTGRVPHAGDTPIAVAFQHVHSDIPAPSGIKANIPAVIDTIVAKATARDPQLRYQSVEDFLADVRIARTSLETSSGLMPLVPNDGDSQPTEIITRPNRNSPFKNANVSHNTLITDRADVVEPVQGRKRSNIARKLIALIVVISAIAGWYVVRSTQTSVPQLVGSQLEQAIIDLEKSELKANVASRVFSDTVLVDVVISADPPSGSTVSKSSTINLVISKGPEKFAVPEVRGKTLAEVTSEIESIGLKVGQTSSSYDSEIAEGLVISATPAPGKLLEPGSKIDLKISKGPEPIAVPSVSGKTQSDAQAALVAAGFSDFVIVRDYSMTVAKDRVISTSPKAGEKKIPSTSITLKISDGPPPVTVPDVFGKTQSAATSTLESEGLEVKVSFMDSCGKKKIKSTTVVSQSVSDGTVVPRGTTVGISVFRKC
jgi:serine/threonine-protein kinase